MSLYKKCLNFLLFFIAIYPRYSFAQDTEAKEYDDKGIAYYNNDNNDLAIQNYNKAIEIDPTFKYAYYNRGLAYNEKGNYDQAIQDYTRFIKLDANDSDAYYERGLAYYNKGNYDQAIQDYNKAIKLGPGYTAAYNNRGRAYDEEGDYDRAIQDYNKAIGLDPGYAAAYNNRGRAYDEEGDYDRAIQDYIKAIGLDPRYATAYNNRGSVYDEKGNYDQAIQDYSIAIKLNPNYASAYNNRGNAYDDKGNDDKAIADYDKAIALDPKYSFAFHNKGFAYYNKGNYDEAIQDYSKAIELDSKYTNAYNDRGRAYYYQGNYDKAAQDFYFCLNLEPLNKYALLNILPCLIRQNLYNEALTIYNKYKTNNVNGYLEDASWEYYKYYLNAALIYVKDKRYNDALKELKTAEEKYSNNTANKTDVNAAAKKRYADVLALKGYILENLKLTTDAEAAYNQALLINPNQPEIKDALKFKNPQTTAQENTDYAAPSIELISPTPLSLVNLSVDDKIQVIGRVKDIPGISKLTINNIVINNIEDDGLFVTALTVVEGTNAIQITVVDKKGNNNSKTFSFNCRIIGKENNNIVELPIQNADHSNPKYYAILIAEKDYIDPSIPSLQKPIEDALKLKQILITKYNFPTSNIDTVFNRSREEILGTIIKRCNTLTEDDNLLIFYAGHGTAEKDWRGDIVGYLIPSSAQKGNEGSYISSNDIIQALSKGSQAKHILMITDACFSGALTREIPKDMPQNVQLCYGNKSRRVMTSGNLETVEDNSYFMYSLLKKLDENQQKYLIADQLFNSFKNDVQTITHTLPKYEAIPSTNDEGGDFIFIKK